MTVLYIMGLLLVIASIYGVTVIINGYSHKRFSYEFFNWVNLVVTSIGYYAIYFGINWYKEAVVSGGDILNGQILIGIGIALVFAMLLNNIRHTNFIFGTVVGSLQLIIYVPVSVVSLFAVLILLAWASQTKPVYNIN